MENEKNIESAGTDEVADELEVKDDISDESDGDEEYYGADESDEDEDAFDSLYDDEDSEGDSLDDPKEESDDSGEEEPEGNKGDERDEQLREALDKNKNLGDIANVILKELGESTDGDAEKALLKVAAEATGKSEEEILRDIAAQKAANEAWEKQSAEDIKAIHDAFPEARKYKSLYDLPNKVEFARLMDSGKSVKQAFILSHPDIAERQIDAPGKKNNLAGTKSHLNSSVPKGAKDTSVNISKAEMARLSDIFGNLSKSEIKALYKKVSK